MSQHKCPAFGNCCDKPDVVKADHDCAKDKPSTPPFHICEGCAMSECRNCGDRCDCEL